MAPLIQITLFSFFYLLHIRLLKSEDFEANIVAIFATESELQLNTEAVQVAVFLGVQQANRLYPHIKFNVFFRNDSNTCFENQAGVLAAESYYKGKVTAFVGPACSKALDPVSRMASYWGLPIYTAGGVDTLFSRKHLFSTLTRLSFSLDQVCKFIVNVSTCFTQFTRQKIVIFYFLFNF